MTGNRGALTSTVKPDAFSKRERRIMDILYRRGRATVREVMSEIDGTPAYSTVRTQLGVLERKGHVRHVAVGAVYMYRPVVPRVHAQRAALQRVIDTFFGGSVADATVLLSNRYFGATCRPHPRPSGRVVR